LLTVQELRWLGRTTREKKDCRIYDSCDDKQYIFGTGFTVGKYWRSRETDLSLLIKERVHLESEVNLKIKAASSVPMLQWRKRVKERMNL